MPGTPAPGTIARPTEKRNVMKRVVLAALVLLACVGVVRTQEGSRAPVPVRLVALGTVQDGGLPHAACTCERCARARREPTFRRRVASLAIHLPASDRVYLIDATPDLPEQLEAVATLRGRAPAGRVDRAPLAGVLLTHAHIGHYLGLAHLGFEVVHTKDLPVWASPRMAAFLRDNGPWSQLVKLGNVALREVIPGGGAVELGDGVSVAAFAVPHRDEYSDTLAYVIRGPRTAVLYIPDTDSWRAWPKPLPEVIAMEKIDVALLDGTFYSLDELPGRSVTAIGHPLITETMDLLESLVKAGRLRVAFTHLNHSNPALAPESPARKAIEARGFRVLVEGEEIEL